MKYVVQEKFFAIGEDNTITTDAGQPVYQVDGKALSLHNLMIISDMSGNEVGRVSKKIMSVLPTYDITLADGTTAEFHQKFSLLHPSAEISINSSEKLELTGNFVQHDFTIQRNGETIATISRAWVSLTGTYGVETTDGQNDLLILGCVLALENEQKQDHR